MADGVNNDRLVLVSNREPYIHEMTSRGILCKKPVGGLVSTLDPIMRSSGGLWVAWGSGSADFIASDGMVMVPPENPRYMLKRIRLSEKEIGNYYRGFSNRTLWPIFHLFPERARFSNDYWRYYQIVNSRFGDKIIDEIGQKDLIWVHDYHLALVPRFIREAKKDARIAFFWHIPWVPWDVFGKLPWRYTIFDGLLGSDLIGFHTSSYVRNFMDCAERMGISVDKGKGKVSHNGHETKVLAIPIGIDYERFKGDSNQVRDAASRLAKRVNAKILLGVDRLDYTKGILRKFLAFEKFFEKYPGFKSKVVLLQIATPSRTRVEEYRMMKREVDEQVGRINGKLQTMGWVPIRYFYSTIPQEQLLAYYKAVDVALITPLVDGLNLVAKEYIAACDDGVLILSEFAGASEELREAIIVNPYDIEAMADRIKESFEISHSEKTTRLLALKERVKRKDVYWWFNNFLREWKRLY